MRFDCGSVNRHHAGKAGIELSAPQKFSVGWEDADQRLDRWMRRRFKGLVQSRIEGLCRKGRIRVDGSKTKPSTRLREGQTIEVPAIDEGRREAAVSGQNAGGKAGSLSGRILFADEFLIAVDKPAGLAVQGGTGQNRHIDRMAPELGLGEEETLRLVHRLDKDTSGVLVMARTRRASAALAELFRLRRVHKLYWAVVCGAPAEDSGDIRSEMERRQDASAGKQVRNHPALTRFTVVDRVGNQFALVALNPVTGRSHQLRIHMAELGTPIVGDRKYGSNTAAKRSGLFQNRLHLHARAICMEHPFTGKRLEIAAPPPPHMADAFRLLGWRPEALAPSDLFEEFA